LRKLALKPLSSWLQHFVRQYTLPLLAYAVTWLLFYPRFQHYFIPDGLYYIDSARFLLNGHWADAVNGYWSPLYSWLLLPVYALSKDSVLSLQMVNFCCGWAILIQTRKLLRWLQPNAVLFNTLATAVLAPLLAAWCTLYTTPDPLFLALLLLYSRWCLQKKHLSQPVGTALLGLALYFTKSYGFFFFIIHWSFFTIFTHTQRRAALRMGIKTLLFFFLGIGVWMALLFTRYQRPVLSTSGAYNHAIMRSGGIIHPCDTGKLIMPRQQFYRSAWNEMTEHINYTNWSLFQNGDTRNLQWRIIKKNTGDIIGQLQKTPRYGLYLLVLLLIAGLVFNTGADNFFSRYCLFTIPVFSAGYLLFFTEERYLIFPSLLACIWLLHLSYALLQHLRWPVWLAPLCFLYIAGKPAYDLYRHTNIADENSHYRAAKQLEVEKSAALHIASFEAYRFAGITAYNNWKDYGGLKGYDNDSTAMLEDLRQYAIDLILLPADKHLPLNVAQQYNILVYKDSILHVWRNKQP
jgi:hypothetical protein